MKCMKGCLLHMAVTLGIVKVRKIVPRAHSSADHFFGCTYAPIVSQQFPVLK